MPSRVSKFLFCSRRVFDPFLFTLQEFVDNLVKEEELPESEKEKFMVIISVDSWLMNEEISFFFFACACNLAWYKV